MPFTTCLIIMVGGALGTLARYVVSVLALPISRQLPWGTILINITGSFVIGFFGTLTLAHGRYPVSENVRLFVMIGLCGGYTTFSSFSLQTLDLLRVGAPGACGTQHRRVGGVMRHRCGRRPSRGGPFQRRRNPDSADCYRGRRMTLPSVAIG